MFATGYSERADGGEAVRGYLYRPVRNDSRTVPLNPISLHRTA